MASLSPHTWEEINNRPADFSCCVSVLLPCCLIVWPAVKQSRPSQLCLWPPTRLPSRNNTGVICPELVDLETPFLPSVSWLWPLPSIHTHTHTQLAWLLSHTRPHCAAYKTTWFLLLSLLAHSDPVWITDRSFDVSLGR